MTEESETLRERTKALAHVVLEKAARELPTASGRRAFMALGSVAHALLPGLRATVAANQARALGRPTHDPVVVRSTREAFRTYARYWFDSFDLMDWSDDLVRASFRFEGFDRFGRALEMGHGAIAALPHMGNWDAAGRAMAAYGIPVVTVAETLRPPRLYRQFLTMRRALRMEVIGLDDESVGRQLSKALSENRVIALVADRDLTGRGVEVEMFGERRRLPAGPALLSITSGAPLLVTPVYHTRNGWRCIVRGPLEVERTGDRRTDVTALTCAMAQVFEEAISAAPADWHMFQPGWG